MPSCQQSDESVAAALKDIKMAIQATRVLQHQTRIPSTTNTNISPPSTTIDTVLPLPNENGIEDPWIKRQQLTETIPTASAAAVVLNLPSAPAPIFDTPEPRKPNLLDFEPVLYTFL